MLRIPYTIVIWALGMSVLSSLINCTQASKAEDSEMGQLDGQLLIDLGVEFNMTMWRVIGKAIKQIENEMCRLHPCSEWSDWSDCNVNVDPFEQIGARTRSRTCGNEPPFCERKGISNVVKESQMCENNCPEDYTVTKHRFCVKLYSIKKQRDEAEKVCENDGGHLVNIDSMSKVQDVNETLLSHSLSDTLLYIDGRRTVQAGTFTYGYKMADPAFTFWGDNDPDNGPTGFCMIYQKDHSRRFVWRLFDYPCDLFLKFMCEIQPSYL